MGVIAIASNLRTIAASFISWIHPVGVFIQGVTPYVARLSERSLDVLNVQSRAKPRSYVSNSPMVCP
jgi:hypothetical protein